MVAAAKKIPWQFSFKLDPILRAGFQRWSDSEPLKKNTDLLNEAVYEILKTKGLLDDKEG